MNMIPAGGPLTAVELPVECPPESDGERLEMAALRHPMPSCRAGEPVTSGRQISTRSGSCRMPKAAMQSLHRTHPISYILA